MAINIVVNNQPIAYPSPGDSPGWGEAATQFAEEVADVLNDLQGTNDIPQTSFTIQNNITSSTNVAGLAFNTGQVRAAVIEYSLYRVSTANPSGHAETGVIRIVYDNAASSGNKWLMTIGETVGNAGVTFTITDSGQFQYQSTDINSTGYTGTMRFRARTLSQ